MKTALKIIQAELIRVKNDYTFYWFDYLMTHINFLILFSGIFTITLYQKPIITDQDIVKFIFGTLVWYFSYGIVTTSAQILSEEIQLETINQLLSTRSNFYLIIVCRQFLQLSISLCFICLFYAISLSTLKVDIDYSFYIDIFPSIFSLLALCFWGLFGIGLIISGLSFVFRRVNSFALLMNYIFLFFTGFLYPIDVFEGACWKILLLIPLTHANTALANLLQGHDITTEYFSLFFLCLIYIALGCATLNYFFKRKMFSWNLRSRNTVTRMQIK